mmetsp:Transcript_1949/g.3694  ORF Transcript_1949/g.3694 Transcript_1949/m.3694 type:complete len:85 (+) Transcript_1949:1583-1837(+)
MPIIICSSCDCMCALLLIAFLVGRRKQGKKGKLDCLSCKACQLKTPLACGTKIPSVASYSHRTSMDDNDRHSTATSGFCSSTHV